MSKVESGGDSLLCPYEYYLWARGAEGAQRITASWLATEL
jgi:hypothetical protein